jgi:hypothetical protein
MKRRDVSPSSWLGAASKLPVPDLTSFADIQLNARVLLQIHAKAKHDERPTTSGRKSICAWRLVFFRDTKPVPIQVSKTSNDFVDQLQDLEELYQELLALRMRVRRAERAKEKRASVGPKTKTSNPAGRKQQPADKRAR